MIILLIIIIIITTMIIMNNNNTNNVTQVNNNNINKNIIIPSYIISLPIMILYIAKQKGSNGEKSMSIKSVMTLRSFCKFITFFSPIEVKNNTSKRVSPMMTLLSKHEILLEGSVITKVKTENFEKFSQ